MYGVNEDLSFAKLVNLGVGDACEKFVNEYTDLVLSKIWNLMKTHCNYPAREKVCSLIILQKQRKGSSYSEDQCDECMDSYIWLFEFLKNKIKAYKGTNNCSLRTFVWSIVPAHSTYMEVDPIGWTVLGLN